MKDWNRNNTIAEFVRNSRKASKMTQLELSDLTGVGIRFIRDIEQGKPNLMTAKINQVLLFFGQELSPRPISDATRRNLLA
ncbi:helix-turn-helix transcriptional regulator [Subsaximicrobium wynnwilliamsii]|uniref:Helix-turn-helix transcriptional regulator n=1 Tax=Subsaximicrobium wynnwilliamsii TaxID=291179 RepID=A0A5C6ZPN1_9FLAO|nr:helix-turn-helix domain-containing protein [Subsaximicrobium wynnwilliamsii]TXD84939.1 helix-turn-helix transcriptional regulator [Subsaximicrobium wynnwilliamsii]TXD90610.1 helix-turn-helix transcriptional regulator [Subsaximicrobium wynnwilliamsii]TXE05084.1 helix-turn-helix transcriptional regulator [Subsaximicrobium wynnwilliamsii]